MLSAVRSSPSIPPRNGCSLRARFNRVTENRETTGSAASERCGEVRRAIEGPPREAALDAVEDEVESSGNRLGSERQAIGGLPGNPRRRERFGGKVEVREGTFVHDGCSVEPGCSDRILPALGLNPLGDHHELFLAIAAGEPEVGRGIAWHEECGRSLRQPRAPPRCRAASRGCARGIPIRGRHRCRRHRRMRGWARVRAGRNRRRTGRRIGNPIGHRDDDVIEAWLDGLDEQALANGVLVGGASSVSRHSYPRNVSARKRVCWRSRSVPRSPDESPSVSSISCLEPRHLLALPA